MYIDRELSRRSSLLLYNAVLLGIVSDKRTLNVLNVFFFTYLSLFLGDRPETKFTRLKYHLINNCLLFFTH